MAVTRLYALVSDQGTATAETALCAAHLDQRAHIQHPGDVPADADWEDCTGNDALRCTVCGVDNRGRRDE